MGAASVGTYKLSAEAVAMAMATTAAMTTMAVANRMATGHTEMAEVMHILLK